MKNLNRIFLMLLVVVLFAACEKADDADGGSPIDPIDRPLSGDAIIIGIVTDTQGNAMPGVNVSAGNSTAITNYKGRFQLDDAPEGSDIVVDFELDGYMKTQKKLATVKGKERLILASMTPVGTVTKIDNATGGTASDKGMKVEFPANSFVTLDGSTFSGQAEVEVTFVPTTSGNFEAVFPGDFSGLREDGSRSFVQSFGFADVNISSAGEQLKLAPGKKAKLTYPVANSQQSDAPASIPLWYYDYERGDWIEEGAATLSGNEYIGEVSHFTPWNIDKPIDVCDLTGRVVDGEGNPLANALVICTAQNQNGWRFSTHSDENGDFSTPVQAETEIEAVAFYSAVSSQVESKLTGAEGSNNVIADLIIDLSSLEAGWEEVDLGTTSDLGDIHFIDCEHGWAVTTHNRRGNNQPELKVFRTQDGGETWTSTAVSGQFKYESSRSVIRFRDKNFGVVTSMYGHFYTTDGGETWMPLDQNGQSAYMTDNIVFGSGNTIKLLSYFGLSITSDLGASWTTVQHPDISKKPNDHMFFFSHVVDDDNFYMYYGNDHMEVSDFTVARTSDGGETWTAEDITGNPFNISGMWGRTNDTFDISQMPPMHSLDNQNHFALAQNGLFNSNNYMTSWSLKGSEAPYMPTALFMTDDDNGFAGTAMGGLFRTKDGGQTWTQYLTGGGGAIYDIHMCDVESGWAVGGGGMLLRLQKEPWIDNL